MKHSEGKISVIDDRWLQIGVVRDPNAIGIVVVADTEEGLEGDCPHTNANAERLAACWNACDGLEYPEAITTLLSCVESAIGYLTIGHVGDIACGRMLAEVLQLVREGRVTLPAKGGDL